MNQTEFINERIKIHCDNLKKDYYLEFGDPLYDDAVKFLAMKNLYKLSLREKMTYLNNLKYFEILPKEQCINFNLTLIKLLEKEDFNFEILNYNKEKNMISGNLWIILTGFNDIKTNEYDTYYNLITNKKILNHISKIVYNNNPKDKSLHDIKLKIDYCINKYRNEFLNKNFKELLDEIITDLDLYIDLKGRRI